MQCTQSDADGAGGRCSTPVLKEATHSSGSADSSALGPASVLQACCCFDAISCRSVTHTEVLRRMASSQYCLITPGDTSSGGQLTDAVMTGGRSCAWHDAAEQA